MGSCASKTRSMDAFYACERELRNHTQKARLLQEEIDAVAQQREEESRAYEAALAAFSLKKDEWKKERKELREEVKRLRRRWGKREEEDGMVVGVKSCEKEGKAVVVGTVNGGLMAEQTRVVVESGRRDEAVEKWKMLYLEIKNELDDLIDKTYQGGAICWEADRYIMGELQRELNCKNETIQVLKAQIASMEQEANKRKREVGMLRQSLKILCSKKRNPYCFKDQY
ncbi:hypothetical protein Nepgr_020602 [Nepenthes gracilis]|uniref:Uncharacterized protein n=1 Tax=Nepenthes gracilis TaxID=150966 RepID=A0AAD3SXK1_NEPGR|nr:hypothetical protein Nepgr_020602 [Nepenthes gracilis]